MRNHQVALLPSSPHSREGPQTKSPLNLIAKASVAASQKRESPPARQRARGQGYGTGYIPMRSPLLFSVALLLPLGARVFLLTQLFLGITTTGTDDHLRGVGYFTTALLCCKIPLLFCSSTGGTGPSA